MNHGRHRAGKKSMIPLAHISEYFKGKTRAGAVIAVSPLFLVTGALPQVDAHASEKPASAVTQEIDAVPSADVFIVDKKPNYVHVENADSVWGQVTDEQIGQFEQTLNALTAENVARVAAAQAAAEEAERQAEQARRAAVVEARGESVTIPSRSDERQSLTVQSKTESPTALRVAEVAQPVVETVSKSNSSVVSIAEQYLGIPYVMGGSSPSGFDCSGLTQYVYGKVGVSLPRTADAQSHVGTTVSVSSAQPGDLVFFMSGSTAYHVGIVIGSGMMIVAPHTGTVVKKEGIYSSNVIYKRVV